MSTLDAIERFGLDRAVLWTHPPLVHFTTADLNNLADGRYDMPAFANVVHEMNAVVLVTPEHLMEWVPVAADSQRRRLALADSLPMSFAEWGYSTAWTPGPTTELQTATAAQLEWLFYDERREVREWLEKRRAFWRGMGEVDFFWRAGQASNGGTIAEFEREGTKLMERFHQKNGACCFSRSRRGSAAC